MFKNLATFKYELENNLNNDFVFPHRNLAELKDFVNSMKDAGTGAAKAEEKVEEKAEVFTHILDVDNFKETVKEGRSNM